MNGWKEEILRKLKKDLDKRLEAWYPIKVRGKSLDEGSGIWLKRNFEKDEKRV